MASYIFKIKHGDDLRRVTVSRSYCGRPDMTYSQLEDTIRQTFKIPASSDVVVTYTDNDNDVVTMTGDQDLDDACVLQGLNPLRLTVTIRGKNPEPEVDAQASAGRWGSHASEQKLPDLKNFVDTTMKFSQETAKQTAGHVTQVLHACEPLIKGAPKMVVSEVVDSLIKAFSSQPGSAAREDLSEPFLGPHLSVPPKPFAGCPAPGSPAPSPIGPNGEGEFGGSTKFMDRMSSDGKDAVHHQGVQCDVCNMCPIVGTRYKSNKQHDYDLCRICFQEFGRLEDYTQIDRPVWRPRHIHPQSFGGRMMRCPANPSYYGGRPSFHMRGPHMHGNHGPCGGKVDHRSGGPSGGAGGRLDARFVQDVTIFDGTELAPGTSFTKIWRLRNSGTFAWPKSTQLVHVGGDELGSVFTVTVELPEEGLAPDGEVEVSVDLVAPEKPGRYVSHWRLVSPAGQKFGHRVWVLIQVVPKDEPSPQMLESLIASQEDIQDSEEVEKFTPAAVSIDVQPTKETGDDLLPQFEKPVNIYFVDGVMTLNSEPVAEQPPIVSDAAPEKIEYPEVNLQGMPVAEQPSIISDAAPEKIEYPEINLQVIPPLELEEPKVIDGGNAQEENATVESGDLGNFAMVEMPSAETPQLSDTPQPSNEDAIAPMVVEGEDGSFTTEKEGIKTAAEADSADVMLGTLEAMGFKQRGFNFELLKKNAYDMQRTLDDLVMAAEWDPMLEELEEMGFYDTDMNRRLMFKNNGSVKRVVKELVQMYKDPKGEEQL